MNKFLLTGLAAGLAFMAQGADAESLYKCEEKLDTKRQVVMDAMTSELDRSKKNLKMEDYKDPFFISYNIRIEEEEKIHGTYGATQFFTGKVVLTRAEIRVGSHEEIGTCYHNFNLPSEEPYAIRRALWLASDKAIKGAERNFYAAKAEEISLVKNKELSKISKFSKEEPNVCMGNDTKLEFDQEKLEGVVARVSSEFNGNKEIINSDVVISGKKVTNYFINTEGTRLVQSSTFYRTLVVAELLNDEGESFASYRILHQRLPEEFPSEEALIALTKEVKDELKALEAAPKLGPTSAPAILDQHNTGVFWHEVIGHRLEGERVYGIASEGLPGIFRDLEEKFTAGGGTFKDKIGKKITSELVTLVDDPTMARFGDKTLNGHYLFDDEGVKGQRVLLIKEGVLKNYLMSRKPIPGFANSNGHGRTEWNSDAIARMGNTMLIPKRSVTYAKLKQLARQEAKKQGKDFYLIFKQSSGGLTSTSGFSTFQAFKVMPVLTYKVDVKTGKEILVRPIEQVGTPLNMLEEIMAFGNDTEAWNGHCGAESGWVPVSVISPSMLLRKVEVQNMSKSPWISHDDESNTPPILPPPKP